MQYPCHRSGPTSPSAQSRRETTSLVSISPFWPYRVKNQRANPAGKILTAGVALTEFWQRLGPQGLSELKHACHVQQAPPKATREKRQTGQENPSLQPLHPHSCLEPSCTSLSLLAGANPKTVSCPGKHNGLRHRRQAGHPIGSSC